MLTTNDTTTRVQLRPQNERELCALIGPGLSTVTVPVAILTSLAGRPQLRYVGLNYFGLASNPVSVGNLTPLSFQCMGYILSIG